MTPQSNPANYSGPPDRLVIEIDVATIKRMCHLMGAHCPFNECFKEILYLTKVCETAEEQYAQRAQEQLKAEARADGVREFQTEQAAKKVQDELEARRREPQAIDDPAAAAIEAIFKKKVPAK